MAKLPRTSAKRDSKRVVSPRQAIPLGGCRNNGINGTTNDATELPITGSALRLQSPKKPTLGVITVT